MPGKAKVRQKNKKKEARCRSTALKSSAENADVRTAKEQEVQEMCIGCAADSLRKIRMAQSVKISQFMRKNWNRFCGSSFKKKIWKA